MAGDLKRFDEYEAILYLLWNSNTAYQIGKARIGAKIVKIGRNVQPNQKRTPFGEGFLQPSERLVAFVKA